MGMRLILKGGSTIDISDFTVDDFMKAKKECNNFDSFAMTNNDTGKLTLIVHWSEIAGAIQIK